MTNARKENLIFSYFPSPKLVRIAINLYSYMRMMYVYFHIANSIDIFKKVLSCYRFENEITKGKIHHRIIRKCINLKSKFWNFSVFFFLLWFVSFHQLNQLHCENNLDNIFDKILVNRHRKCHHK